MAKKTEEQEIAARCIERAKKRFGAGWALLSKEIQWAFIAEEVLGALFSQSATLDAEYKLMFFRRVRSEAERMLRPETDDA